MEYARRSLAQISGACYNKGNPCYREGVSMRVIAGYSAAKVKNPEVLTRGPRPTGSGNPCSTYWRTGWRRRWSLIFRAAPALWA
jgi:hypothetical protein